MVCVPLMLGAGPRHALAPDLADFAARWASALARLAGGPAR